MYVQSVGNGVVVSYEGGGSSTSSSSLDGREPKSGVLDLSPLGNVQQTLGSNVLRSLLGERLSRLVRSGESRVERLAVILLELSESLVSLGPGGLLTFSDDRPERDPDARAVGTSGLLGFSVDAVDLLPCLLERLSPESEDVGEGSSNAVSFRR